MNSCFQSNRVKEGGRRFGVARGITLGLACNLLAKGVVADQVSSAGEDETVKLDAANCIPRAALDAYVNRSIARQAEFFSAFHGPKHATVFLGSGFVEEAPWDALFPEYTVVNRGIRADTTAGAAPFG